MSTDWELQYQKRETPWDKQAAHPFIQEPEWTERGGSWLVPGCGYGDDLVALLDAGADRVLGMDVAPSAIAGAKLRHEARPELTFTLGDFLAMPTDERAGTFDGLWEHTCFCAIQPEVRERYVAAAAAALRPGGVLVGCFYMNPWDPDEDQTQGPPFGSEVTKLDAMFERYFVLEREIVPRATHSGREGRELVRFLRRRA
jgi:SAM-dependent methyltransferase